MFFGLGGLKECPAWFASHGIRGESLRNEKNMVITLKQKWINT